MEKTERDSRRYEIIGHITSVILVMRPMLCVKCFSRLLDMWVLACVRDVNSIIAKNKCVWVWHWVWHSLLLHYSVTKSASIGIGKKTNGTYKAEFLGCFHTCNFSFLGLVCIQQTRTKTTTVRPFGRRWSWTGPKKYFCRVVCLW